MDKETEKLLEPCPFCKSSNLDTLKIDPKGYFVDCDDCFAQGQIKNTEAEAEKAWNKRG